MASSVLSYRDAVRELDARGQGIRPDLGRIRALADLLDHPERTYPSIQVTGTNGKSSTVRMIGRILAAHGLKTGLYSSPRLQSIRECFVVADESSTDLISQEDFAATLQYLRPFVEVVELERDEDVTSFELLTALAFEWMAQQTVGAGVFEVGMGGAWDATNVAPGQVAAITRVAVDHERFLGPTPLDNAREKAGIVKPEARVVSADQDPEVLALVERAATAYTERREAMVAALRAVGIAATAPSGLNVWVPVPDEDAAVRALLAAGASVAAGAPYRLDSGPAIRITTAALPPADAPALAAALAAAVNPPRRTRAA